MSAEACRKVLTSVELSLADWLAGVLLCYVDGLVDYGLRLHALFRQNAHKDDHADAGGLRRPLRLGESNPNNHAEQEHLAVFKRLA